MRCLVDLRGTEWKIRNKDNPRSRQSAYVRNRSNKRRKWCRWILMRQAGPTITGITITLDIIILGITVKLNITAQ